MDHWAGRKETSVGVMHPWLAFVSFPSAPFTQSLVTKALRKISPSLEILSSKPEIESNLIQWASYDYIDHELLLSKFSNKTISISSSYIIRKALIRKHFLSRTITNHITKYPQ